MTYTKEDVSLFRCVNGVNVQLSEADRQAIADEWNENEAKAELDKSADVRAARDIDSPNTKDKLLFEINFQQENRIRVLEGKAQITRAQYRDALISAWKTL